ncbi:MAG: SGNH/GDSL hydrolase family protein [Victivallaceae bacterium]|nr:SGNH/GDSL hydrolase family protein [Victivallaceae bacterium]
MLDSHWIGRRIAFIGDSISDPCHVGTTRCYWEFLAEWLGIEPLVYAESGKTWLGVPEFIGKLEKEHGTDVDAVIVFMGTNDFNHSVPLGNWWQEGDESVNHNGIVRLHRRRLPVRSAETFRGRINIGMELIRRKFSDQLVAMSTILHRGFATFGPGNVQPDESFANDIGLFASDYNAVIREAGDIWAAPVIDIAAESGLHPMTPGYGRFFHDPETDMLHPSCDGHRRIALGMMHRLLALPAGYR